MSTINSLGPLNPAFQQTKPQKTVPNNTKPVFSQKQRENLKGLADLEQFNLTHGLDIKSRNPNREYNFKTHGITFEKVALPQKNFKESLEIFLEDNLGEGGATTLVGVAGIAHLATGGKVEFSQGTEDFLPYSKLKFEVGKDKVKAGWKVDF